MAPTPDGMGADRHRERQNMQEAAHGTPEPKFDVIAEDDDGEELYETESAWTEEEARDTAAELNSSRNDYLADAPEEVARFTYRPRSER